MVSVSHGQVFVMLKMIKRYVGSRSSYKPMWWVLMNTHTPYIRLVKFQLVRQIPDVYVSACVLAAKLFLLFFLVFVYFS